MSTTKTIAQLAAGLAAGSITEDAVSEQLGDESLVADVVAMASGMGVGTVAAAGTGMLLESDIGSSICNTVDDVASSLNPFNW